MAMLCGAADKVGQVMVIASPVEALQSLGPRPLEQIVEGMAQEFGGHPSAVVIQKINGSEFERADIHAQIDSPTPGKVELWGSLYAAKVNSDVVKWNLVDYLKDEWEQLVTAMDSVQISASRSLTASASPRPAVPTAARARVAQDFQIRLDAFLSAWISERNQKRTMEFLDSAAFSAPPLIGSYCDG
jgi:hypothetical protein